MKKDLLNKLGETKLNWPKGLRKFAHQENVKMTGYHIRVFYINTLELWRGKLLMRTFAFKPKRDRKYNDPIQEVCRRLEGEKEVILCQIDNYPMSGHVVYYTDTGRWVTKKDQGEWYSWYRGDKKNWWFCDSDMFDVGEWIQRLGIQYCGYDSPDYINRMSFFKYVEMYRKYPKIELLAKSGWGHLISGARYFNFSGKSFEQIFKIPKCWKEHMSRLDVIDILLIRKHKISSIEELATAKEINARKAKYINQNISAKMLAYILDQCSFGIYVCGVWVNGKGKNGIAEYNDYLRLATEMGYPMDHKEVLYPKNIKLYHDDLQKKYKQIKSELVNKGIKATANKLMKYRYESDGLIIVPAQSNEELIAESKALNHCVRTYAEKVAEGKTGIMFVRKSEAPDVPYVTLELNGKKVIQVRAEYNNVPAPEVSDMVRRWEKKFRLSGW